MNIVKMELIILRLESLVKRIDGFVEYVGYHPQNAEHLNSDIRLTIDELRSDVLRHD